MDGNIVAIGNKPLLAASCMVAVNLITEQPYVDLDADHCH